MPGDRFLHEHELQRVVQRCHNVLWERHGFDPAQSFDELSKLLFVKLFDESRASGELTAARSSSSYGVADTARRLFEQAKIAPGFDNVWLDDDRIVADDLTIGAVFGHLAPYSLRETTAHIDGADMKGTIYEHIVGRTFRGELGQFFTPRSIVEFMVRLVGVDESATVYDPSCGSGGFFVMYAKLLREELVGNGGSSPEEIIEKLRDYSRHRLIGTEINRRTARVARLNFLMHGLDPGNIFAANALRVEDSEDPRAEELLGAESVDVVFANPPFAGREKDHSVLRRFELGRSQSGTLSSVTREVLFIERILDVLRFGGTAAIVIPQGIFTNRKLAAVRDHIRKRARMLAVVELPDWAFMPSGTGVRGSLLFVKKTERVPRDYEVFMKRVDNIGFNSVGRPTRENDLPATLEQYRRRDPRHMVRLREIRDRIDAKFYIPEHRRTLSLFADNPRHKLVPLSDVGSFDATRVNPHLDPDREILLVETSSVDPARLTIAPRRVLARDSKHTALRELRAGDVLISRRRTYRGAVVVVPDELQGALAIPEFSILRVNEGFDPDYVVEIMRSSQFLELMTIYSTGEMSGRISERDLMSLRIPVPDDQKTVADAMREHRARVAELEEQAERERDTIARICQQMVDPAG